MNSLFTKPEIAKIATFACCIRDAKREVNGSQETKEITGRSPYCRDRDRILYTKSFRRLSHKTQVHLTSEKMPEHNDHTRTRLTHTLEVAQIAKTMARYLSLNEDLVEAIAFGHDVGHAPFGHPGEDQLNDILNGKVDLPSRYIIEQRLKCDTEADKKRLRARISFGDFRHNYQSVRQLTFLDSYRDNYKGLNLTYQCLDGILRHTNLHSRSNPKRLCKYPGISNGVLRKIVRRDGFKPTIEAKLVALADEIAQVCHDLNDAVDLEIIPFVDLHSQLESNINQALNHLESRRKVIRFSVSQDVNENNRKLFSSLILHYTIKSTLQVGAVLLENYGKDIVEFIDNIPNNPFPESEFKNIETYKNDLVINNYHVNRMDNKGRYIIRRLFYAYLSDPRQLPDADLKRYMNTKRKQLTEELSPAAINKWFTESNKMVKKGAKLSKNEQNIIIKMVENDTDGTSFRKAKPKFLDKLTPFLLQDGDYYRTIVDYIASMTDTFAEKEMASLYGH